VNEGPEPDIKIIGQILLNPAAWLFIGFGVLVGVLISGVLSFGWSLTFALGMIAFFAVACVVIAPDEP